MTKIKREEERIRIASTRTIITIRSAKIQHNWLQMRAQKPMHINNRRLNYCQDVQMAQ